MKIGDKVTIQGTIVSLNQTPEFWQVQVEVEPGTTVTVRQDHLMEEKATATPKVDVKSSQTGAAKPTTSGIKSQGTTLSDTLKGIFKKSN